jgi:predicted NBD/HSP70 family sugar kinase
MKGPSVSVQRKLRVSDTANSLLQNRINISIIFNYLRDHGASYRAQIARDLGISAPAVARAIDKLLKDGYVIESERLQLENGRKASQVSVNAGRGYIIGVDLVSEPIKLAICDFGGTLSYSFLAPPIRPNISFSDYLISIIDLGLQNFEQKINIKDPPILGLGIGVPGVVDAQTGTILYANLYHKLYESKFYERVVGHYTFPVFIENTANLSAIGEWKRGVGRDARNLVCIEFGNGIGAGIICDGELYHGAQGAAGEIGYFITDPEGLDHKSSTLGYLEEKASLGMMHLRGGTVGDTGTQRYPSTELLLKAVETGDPEAHEIIKDVIKHLTVTIVNTVLLLNPEMVIIGGAACELPDVEEIIFMPLMEEVYRNYPLIASPIKVADLGANACLIGAMQYVLDSLVVHAYPYRL